MTKFYTRKGDFGETSLLSGERVPKDSLRIITYGTVDELQAFLGQARVLTRSQETSEILYDVEMKLVQVMAELATVNAEERVTAADVAKIESQIDFFTDHLVSGFKWSLPGESAASSALHVARTVARRCERLITSLSREETVNANVVAYLNRISDLCYTMARCEDEVFNREN